MSMVVFYIIGVVLSMLLNFMVVLVVTGRGKNGNHLDILMLSLAVCDIIRSGIGYPLEINSLFRATEISTTSCTIAGFSITFLSLVSICHLVGISIERCIIINFPWKAREWFANRWIAFFIIIPSWMYALAWSLMPLLGWSSYAREPGASYRCSIDLENDSRNARTYAYSLLVFCFVAPVLSITISSLLTLREMKKMRTEVQNNLDDQNAELRRRQEFRHTIMVFALIMTFLIAWSPYAACVVVMSFRRRVGGTLLTFSAILAKSSTLYNPIIYVIFMKDFRVRCCMLFRRRPPAQPASPPTTPVNMTSVAEAPQVPGEL